jgi:hypothetical protein
MDNIREQTRHPSRGKQADVKRIIELYRTGISMAEVGRIVGHAHGIIKYHLVRNGISIRDLNHYRRKPISNDTIREMYLSGLTAKEIGKELGITYQCVYDRLEEAGVRARSKAEQVKIMMEKDRYPSKKGDKSWNWKGGIQKGPNGYIKEARYINGKLQYIPQHRIVWEQHNGPIPEGHIIHHLNGIKHDNRIENLCMLSRKNHSPRTIVEPYQNRIRELEEELGYQIEEFQNSMPQSCTV